jgi:hypothetical protein
LAGFIGIGAPSRRIVACPASPVASRSAPTEPRSEKPFRAEPVPMLVVSPCGKIQE